MNPLDMFKNFQNIQSQMSEMQDKVKAIRVTGAAGGGMVSVEMNGQMTVLNVHIDAEAVDPEDIGMLEDLVQAACIDASSKVKEKLQEEMSSLTGGVQLPPGLLGM
jgi:nucleoid-associated protein EbfC